MRFSAIALTIAAAVIGSTSASAVAPRSLVSVNQASSLLSRQAACVSICAPAQNDLNACGTEATCICSPSLASELVDCANCQLQTDPTLRSQLQTAWDQYSSGCATMGLPVDGIDGGTNVTPTVIATPATTTPAVVFTPSPIVTSAAAAAFSAAPAVSSAAPAVSSAAPAVSTTSAASIGPVGGNLVAHANAAPILNAGGALGLLVVGVAAALF